MSRPWMPLYVGDYLADTAHLRAAEHGAYLLLIMHYWRTHGLPDDDLALARIARMTNAEWKRSRPVLAALFDGSWKHKRVEFELTEAARISAAGKVGGQASARARRERSLNGYATTEERSFNERTNDLRAAVERLTNDCRNDPATIGQALPSPSPRRKTEHGKEDVVEKNTGSTDGERIAALARCGGDGA